jgi:hypothetical protein
MRKSTTGALALQAALLTIALTLCALWPRAGGAALLLPLPGGHTAAALQWARAHARGGAGRLPGSLVIWPASPLSAAALPAGALRWRRDNACNPDAPPPGFTN